MIRSETEYQNALKQLEEERAFAIQQKAALEAKGYSPEQVERGMQPLLAFHAQLMEEAAWYENVRRRNFKPLASFTQIGRLLIGLRLANGLSQKDLAERLGVSEAAVSRDERNEYHGITTERAQRILEALGETVILTIAGASVADEADGAGMKRAVEGEFADVH